MSRLLGRLARFGPLLVAACGDPALHLGRPGADGAQAMILALPGASTLDVRAIDLVRSSTWLDETFAGEAAFDLTALLYASALSDLGLVEGPIAAVQESECGARPLPAPSEVLAARVDSSALDGTQWRPLDAIPSPVAAFRRAGPCPCRDVEVVFDLELPHVAAKTASRIDGRRAFVAVGDTIDAYTYYEVGPDGVFPVPIENAPLRLFATAYFDDDNIWFGTPDGLFHGGRGRPVAQPSAASGITGVRALDGPSGDDFFFVSSEATLYRFHEGAPETLFSPPLRDSGQDGLVADLGQGQYIAALTQTYQLIRLVGGGIEDMISVPSDTRGATAISLGGDGALYVGTSAGIMLRLEGPDLVAIAGGDQEAQVSVLAPFADGVLVGTRRGGLRQISGRYGYCPFQTSLEDRRFVSVVALDDGQLFIGSSTRGNARAVLLR